MSIRINSLMIVFLFLGLLGIQLFFILNTWDHTANKLETELENIISEVHDKAANDSVFYEFLAHVIRDRDKKSFKKLNAELSLLGVSDLFNTKDVTFEIYKNQFSKKPPNFLLGNLEANRTNFESLKRHHFCLTCVLENNYDNRSNYLELGAVLENRASLQLAELWLPIFLSFLFLLLLSVFSIIILKKWTTAQRLNIQKNGFINNLSHELKTPVFTIKLLSQLIIEKGKDERLTEYGGRIKMEASHMEKQIYRILESTGLESGHLIQLKKIELTSFLLEMRASLKLMCEHHNVKFEFNSISSRDFLILADEIHLKNVINVLVDNAIKYGGAEPRVTIDLQDHGGHCNINISDNGIEIPNKEKEKVLEKFYRVNTSDTNSVAGFGLGLYYANESTKQMHGTLSVLDNSPQGTVVSLWFKTSD